MKNKNEKGIYRLQALCRHHGHVSGGHYVAIGKRASNVIF
jgi:hypothetical protein